MTELPAAAAPRTIAVILTGSIVLSTASMSCVTMPMDLANCFIRIAPSTRPATASMRALRRLYLSDSFLLRIAVSAIM